MPNEEIAGVTTRRLLAFLTLAYVVSWLLWLPLVASSQDWTSSSPPFVLYYLGILGPTVAAFLLRWVDHGTGGIWSLLRKLVLWQVSVKWYLVALCLPVVTRCTALGLLYLFGSISSDFSLRPGPELIKMFLFMLVLVPFEEIGWRGYALPALLTSNSALSASLLLGVVWSLWHLPLMWIRGSYQDSNAPLTYLLIFTVTILPFSILLTWVYNHTEGSLLLASLFHAAINTTEWSLILPERDGVLLLLVAGVLNSILAALIVVKAGTQLTRFYNQIRPVPKT